MSIILHTKEEVHSQNNKLSAQEQLKQEPALKRLKRSDDDFKLPESFEVGRARADGNCFFDSFRQGLEKQLGIIVTVKQLRECCSEFAQNNPPDWFVNAIADSYDNNLVRRNEVPSAYAGNIINNNRWGDPEIEGRILCEKYRVKLHIIEKQSYRLHLEQQILNSRKFNREVELAIMNSNSDQDLASKLQLIHNDEAAELLMDMTNFDGLSATHQLIGPSGILPVNDISYNDEHTIHVVNKGSAHFEPILFDVGKLFNSIKNGNLEEVEKFLKLWNKRVSVNTKTSDGKTLLHVATENGKEKIVEFLLKKPNLDLSSLSFYQNKTPLYIACERGYEKVVELLLKDYRCVYYINVDYKGRKPLHIAAETGYANIVKLLLPKVESINVVDANDQTPLYIAVSKNHKEVVKILSSDYRINVDIRCHGNTPLHASARNGNVEIVKLLLDKRARIDIKNNLQQTPLDTAMFFYQERGTNVINPHLEVSVLLLKKGAFVEKLNDLQKRVLLNYIKNHHQEIIQAKPDIINSLSSTQANPPQQPIGPIEQQPDQTRKTSEGKPQPNTSNIANQQSTLDGTKFGDKSKYSLLEFDENIEKIGKLNELIREIDRVEIPLHFAIEKGDYDKAIDLIRKGENINALNIDGQTPMHIAVKTRNVKIFDRLIDIGDKRIYPDLNIQDNNGQTIIHLVASGKDDVNIFDKLKEIGDINPYIQDNNGHTPLHLAVFHGNVNIFYKLIDFGDKKIHPDLNIQDNNGQTIIHLVASGKGIEHVNIFGRLIKVGDKDIYPDLNIQDNNGHTPLHLAVLQGNVNMFDRLIDVGDKKVYADLNIQDNNGQTIIHLVASGKGIEYVNILDRLKKIGDINPYIQDNNGHTPLHLAVLQGNVNMFDRLIDVGDKKIYPDLNIQDNDGQTLMSLADYRKKLDVGYINIIDRLKRRGGIFTTIQQDENGQTPLYSAIQQENDYTALLKSPYTKARNKDGRTPLHLAVEKKDKNLVKELINKGSNINVRDKNGITPLHLAVQKNDESLVEELISKGSDVNAKDKNGETPIYIAVKKERENLVKKFIEKGANINIRNKNGQTLVHFAAERGQIRLISILVSRTASENINIRNSKGQTILHWAVEEGHEDLVKEFIQRKVDVDAQDIWRQTPLHLIARLGNRKQDVNIAENLINAGANVNIRDNLGRVPLHWAAYQGYEYIVQKFLDHERTDINVKDDYGKTPLCLAHEKGNRRVYDKIREKSSFNFGNVQKSVSNRKKSNKLI